MKAAIGRVGGWFAVLAYLTVMLLPAVLAPYFLWRSIRFESVAFGTVGTCWMVFTLWAWVPLRDASEDHHEGLLRWVGRWVSTLVPAVLAAAWLLSSTVILISGLGSIVILLLFIFLIMD
jgi:hypothetical protein